MPEGLFPATIEPHAGRTLPRLVSEDEIDLDSGFVMMPQAIPQPALVPSAQSPGTGAAPPESGATTLPPTATGGTGGASGASTTVPVSASQNTVEIAFSANRNQLYMAWNTLANLADLAGTLSLGVKAEPAEGFDKTRLENGVLEPLREADLIE